MSKKHFLTLLTIIALFAFFLRVVKIGQVPHGMTWDEAAIGYNGWSIATVHRDEWLKLLPISFKSFGDYKAPFAIYLNGIFTLVLGLKLWIVRLPFVVSGALGVFGIGLLSLSLLQTLVDRSWWQKQKLPRHEHFALLTAFFLAISPWHFHFTRVGFESGLALTEIIWALYFFFLSPRLSGRLKHLSYFFSWFSMALSIYTYHSTKLFTPLLVLLLIFIGFRWFKLGWRYLAFGVLSFMFWLLPFIYDVLFGHGLERAGVTVFSQVEGTGNQLKTLLTNLWLQFSPQFLFLGQVDTSRHGGLPLSVLLPGTGLIIVVGVLTWLVMRFRKEEFQKLDRVFSLSLILVFLGMLPAVIGMIVPHANRALLTLLGFVLLVSFSWLAVWVLFLKKHWSLKFFKVLFGLWLTLQIFGFSFDLYNYFFVWSKDQAVAEAFNDGYLELMEEVKKYESGHDGYPEVNKIIITSEYGQPYIYALFARKTSPIAYHGGSLIKYSFPDVVNVDALSEKNALVVAGKKADLIDKTRADKIIYNSAGEPVFWLYLTD